MVRTNLSWIWSYISVSSEDCKSGIKLYVCIEERPLGYYLFEIYTPAVFIVIMSWLNFWVNRWK